jgi:hypothetical protein
MLDIIDKLPLDIIVDYHDISLILFHLLRKYTKYNQRKSLHRSGGIGTTSFGAMPIDWGCGLYLINQKIKFAL